MSSSPDLGDRFAALRLLASGGMGEVWLARDREHDFEVVVKRPRQGADEQGVDEQSADEQQANEHGADEHAADQQSAALLRHEFAILRRLVHPNIVRAYELHEADGGVFFTTEYVGTTNLCRLRRGSPAEILALSVPIAEALEYAHAQGVVHRDLKCSNVLLDEAGRPRITDFGIAAALERGADDLHLVGGGSGFNESPQQASGEEPQVADDIYGFGALLFELLTGERPAADAKAGAEASAAARPRPSELRKLPPELDDLVTSMLAPRPADRPADMGEVRRRLEAVSEAQQRPEATSEQDREAEASPPAVRPTPIRVSPPPRAANPRIAPVAPSPAARRQDEPGRGRRVATLSLFLVLALVAFAVFVLLPDWVRDSAQRASATQPEAEPTGGVENPAGASQPVAGDSGSGRVGELTSAPLPTRAESSATVPPSAESSSTELSAAAPAPQPPRTDPPPTPRRTTSARPAPDRSFGAAMSAGLKAQNQGEFAQAETAFARALELRPDSPEAAEGLARARQRLRLQAIERHRAQAAALVQNERWREALTEYDAVLAIDPTIRFAIEGKEQAAARAELDSQLEYHLANPDRLASNQVLESARDLLDRARDASPAGPRIQSQAERLARTIEIASTPIPVRLVSDNATEVVVYRVGSLGRFEQRRLELRPGSYTVVGSREGYRDVRRVFRVGPGQSDEPIVVRCEEKI